MASGPRAPQGRRTHLFWIHARQATPATASLPDWAHAANKLADELASETVRPLEFSFQYQQCVDYNRWLDARTWQLQGLLLERATFWLQHREFPGRVQGPKPPKKQQLVDQLAVTHPAHNWGGFSKSGSRQCVICGILVSVKWCRRRILAAASFFCPFSGHEIRCLGARPTHELHRDARGWRCKGCKGALGLRLMIREIPTR